VAWSEGRTATLTESDKAFVDLIMSGIPKKEALRRIYPKRYEGRTNKAIHKSIADILKKPKVKEYKEMVESAAREALDKALEERAECLATAESIAGGLMEQDELMMIYSSIARNENETTANRLKALDSLAKYRFSLDKRQIDLQADVSQQVIIVDDFDGEDDEQDD
jgi:broad specificity phosphatase PhoE